MLATARRSPDLNLDDDGAQLFAQALDDAACRRLEAALAALPTSKPGVRIREGPQLEPFLDTAGPIGAIAASVLGDEARPVRAILFDKTAELNWALGWHQDRTIVVRERMDADGFGPWTVKSGLIQVEPPFAILQRMVTLRVHLDAVDERNAPLRIVPGSHRLGRVSEAEIDRVVTAFGEKLCLPSAATSGSTPRRPSTPRSPPIRRVVAACSKLTTRLTRRQVHLLGAACRGRVEPTPHSDGAVRVQPEQAAQPYGRAGVLASGGLGGGVRRHEP